MVLFLKLGYYLVYGIFERIILENIWNDFIEDMLKYFYLGVLFGVCGKIMRVSVDEF